MFRRILVPMDSYDCGEPALALSRKLARHEGSTVILLWLVPVISSGEVFFDQMQVEPGSSGARRQAEGERYLREITGSLQGDGIRAEPQVLITPKTPEEAIIDYALQEGVDLIVMTTQQRSIVGRFLFGSVDEKVRRRSPIPVLYILPDDTGSSRELPGTQSAQEQDHE